MRPRAGATERRRRLAASAAFVAVTVLTAALLLVALDWAVFDSSAVAPRLAIDDNGTPNEKLLQAARYRDAEVVYLGDSRIFYGIDPDVVSETCGCGSGYNAAVPAADTRLTRLMSDRLLHQISPELVVIGVSQWDLSDGAGIRVWGPARDLVAPWEAAEFGVALDPAEQVDAAVGSLWRLFHYRDELRAALDPSTSAGLPAPRRGFDEYHEPRKLRDEHLDERQQQWFTDFSVDGRRNDALGELVADLDRRGIRVVLVAPPLYPSFHGRVRGEVEAFRGAVERLAAERGAQFEDFTESRRSGLELSEFRDAVHLDDDGAEKLSRRLGKAIRSHAGGR